MFVRIPAILLIACALCVAGCNRRQAATVSSWSGAVATDDTTAWYATRDDRVGVVVWVDSGGGTSGSGSNGRTVGWVRTRGGKTINIGYDANAGVNGTVRIDGIAYDVSKGGVFLVYSREEPLRTVQLSRQTSDLRAFPPGDVANLAKADSDVRHFIEAARSIVSPATSTSAPTGNP